MNAQTARTEMLMIMQKVNSQTFLFLLEDTTLRYMTEGQSPDMAYSHDRCMLHMAHEALRQGHSVYVTSRVRNNRFRQITQVYPSWRVNNYDQEILNPSIVVGIEFSASGYKATYPKAKVIAVHAALYYVENPAMFCSKQMHDLLLSALPRQIDFVLVQNQRMKDIILPVYMLMGWLWPERLLVAPFGYIKEQMVPPEGREAERKRLGLGKNDIAIVNAGGVWKWTDFNAFLLAFVKAVRAGHTHLKLVQPGLRQPENDDHGDYLQETQALLDANRDLIGKNIILLERWMAHADLRRVVAACDVGLNVSRDGLEHWQSHRVRVLEYIQAGIPVINTYGDAICQKAREAMYPVLDGEYEEILADIATNKTALLAKTKIMQTRFTPDFSSAVATAALISKIVSEPLLERAPRPAPLPAPPPQGANQNAANDEKEWRKKPMIYGLFKMACQVPGLGYALRRISRGLYRLEGKL